MSGGRAEGPRRATETPRRVRVTSPRRQARTRAPSRPPTDEIDEQTGLGEVYVDYLLRAQRRLSVSVLAGVVLVVGTLPLLFLLVPTVRDLRVGPIRLPWIILGGLIYLFAFAVARAYVRTAERLERDFAEFLHGRDGAVTGQ
ncbi:MAG TPA: hypothetical protein VES01_00805 [Dermatophilaceae bacterium]|nr:hypothetical protein [Dermatophilaceae bacterium]